MSLFAGRRRASWPTDLVVGTVVCLIVLGLAMASPTKAGFLLAAAAIGAAVGLLALNDPLLALVTVVAASFLRLAQKESPAPAPSPTAAT